MRTSETRTLERGLVISTWPASTGGGGEINLRIDPPFVVPETAEYLIETDTATGSVTFRRVPEHTSLGLHVSDTPRRAQRRKWLEEQMEHVAEQGDPLQAWLYNREVWSLTPLSDVDQRLASAAQTYADLDYTSDIRIERLAQLFERLAPPAPMIEHMRQQGTLPPDWPEDYDRPLPFED
jgi:hypothetical protein